MHVLASAPPGSAWTFGGSILTFAFPMILFIVVACVLYVLYTKPETVPGHVIRPPERPVSYTPVAGLPSDPPAATTSSAEAAAPTGTPASAQAAAPAEAGAAAAAQTSPGTAAETSTDEAVKTEDAE